MTSAIRSAALRVLVLLVGTAMLGCASEPTGPLDRIPDGNWGGDRIGLFVDQSGVTFVFDCSGGRVDQPIVLDAGGNFDVLGTYSGGGNTQNADHSPHPARYAGHATRTHVDVTRTVLDQSDPGVSFSAFLGASPMVVAC